MYFGGGWGGVKIPQTDKGGRAQSLMRSWVEAPCWAPYMSFSLLEGDPHRTVQGHVSLF